MHAIGIYALVGVASFAGVYALAGKGAGGLWPSGLASAGCNIKGNISYKGDARIYHLPGQEDYADTVISPERGERWFCSEADAVAAGWHRAGR